MEPTEEDYQFLPVGEAVSPAKGGFFVHYLDCWWLLHTEKGLAFWNPVNRRTGRRRSGQETRLGAPQMNSDERISRLVREKCPPPFPHEVRRMASVWVPVNISDYRE